MPIKISVDDLSLACNARIVSSSLSLSRDFLLESVFTDSREVREGSIFIARKGESSDGHLFIKDALRNGAKAVILEKEFFRNHKTELTELSRDLFLLEVDSSDSALKRLAKFWRTKLKARTLILTGSNGKTTVKEIVSKILLATVGQGTANIKSFNNHVGVPLTILSSSLEDKWLVLEAGMNHPGELKTLSEIASADVSMILNVGFAHRGNFSSLEEVARSKLEVASDLSENSTFIYNSDDKNLSDSVVELLEKKNINNVIKVGNSSDALLKLISVERLSEDGVFFTFEYQGKIYNAHLPLLGSHNAHNCVFAIAASKALFPNIEIEEIISSLINVKAEAHRLNLIRIGNFKLVDDCYNSNPSSSFEAANVLAALSGERGFLAIVGDMLELEELSSELHFKVGEYLAKKGAKGIVAKGSYAKDYLKGASNLGCKNLYEVSDYKDVLIALKELIKRNDVNWILVKGSRGATLEKILPLLESELYALSHTD